MILDQVGQNDDIAPSRWSDDCRYSNIGEESPGSTEARCWLTASEGDLRESATERKPPRLRGKGERVR